MSSEPLVRLDGVSKQFTTRTGGLLSRRGSFQALDSVSFTIERGSAFGLIGESGSGKSTVARLLLRLLQPSSGRLYYRGQDISALTRTGARAYCRQVQVVFQDSAASFNPRRFVGDQIVRPLLRLELARTQREARALAIESLERVGLRSDHLVRYPHEFSGGQKQRLVIARALAVKPEFLILDEPTSALDVSIQAQILNLLMDLKESFDLSYLLIGHDLSIVQFLCDQVAVMDRGRIVENAGTETFFEQARDPVSRALLDSMRLPELDHG